MKAGDKIRYKKIVQGVRLGGAEPKVIDYISDEWVIFRVWSSKGEDLGQQVLGRENFDEQFEAGPAFFEEGRSYTRHQNWSIVAQAEDVTETFTVDAVRKNLDGRCVAFGYLVAEDTGIWTTFTQFDWASNIWKEKS